MPPLIEEYTSISIRNTRKCSIETFAFLTFLSNLFRFGTTDFVEPSRAHTGVRLSTKKSQSTENVSCERFGLNLIQPW